MTLPVRPIYIKPDEVANNSSLNFQTMQPDGTMFFTGANVRVYFDDILVEHCDSVGCQLAQNIKPIYGYHSHNVTNWQYGTKVAQGYLQITFTESAYIPMILTAIELRRRARHKAFLTQYHEDGVKDNLKRQKVIQTNPEGIGGTVEEALTALGGTKFNWRDIADEYDARRFGYTVPSQDAQVAALAIPGLFPSNSDSNSFTYAPRGTHLNAEGFTMSIIMGPVEDTFNHRVVWKGIGATEDEKYKGTKYEGAAAGHYVIDPGPDGGGFVGSLIQMHNVRIVAGPNLQISVDGKPVTMLYTVIGSNIT